MLLVRCPTLCIGLTVMPGLSMGTSQVVMALLGGTSFLLKSLVMQSMYFARSASVQNVLCPFITTLPSRRSNEVVMALLSEPACAQAEAEAHAVAGQEAVDDLFLLLGRAKVQHVVHLKHGPKA